MTATPSPRSVEIQRLAAGSYVAINQRGGRIEFGHGGAAFTPVELLLAAIGGCSGIDVDVLTTRRSEPTSFTVTTSGNAIRDESGHRLEDIEVVFDLTFPDGSAGDAAREVLPQAIVRSHDRLCTVSRTVEAATPVTMRVAHDA